MKKHVEHYLQHKSPFHEEDLQALMPPSLRQESVLQIHKVRYRSFVTHVPVRAHTTDPCCDGDEAWMVLRICE